MSWIEFERIDTSHRKVKNFGILFSVITLLASVYLAYHGRPAWLWCAAGCAFFLVTGLSAQSVLRPVYIAWMSFAFVLGWINARIILGLFFYLVLTPIGLFMRLGGKDLLDKKIDRAAESYWVKRERTPFDPKRLERLF